jgi:hypothetical protein
VKLESPLYLHVSADVELLSAYFSADVFNESAVPEALHTCLLTCARLWQLRY